MKAFDVNLAINELFNGKRVRATEWELERYVEVVDGQVITEAGEPFNIMKAKESEWVIWTAPVKKSEAVISRDEALKALYSGKEVKAVDWSDKKLLVKDGQIMVNGVEPFNIMKAKEDKWLIVEDEVKSDNDASREIAELKSLIKELLESKKVEPKAKDSRDTAIQSNSTEMIKAVYGVTTPKQVQELFKERLESAKNSRDIEKVVCEFIPYCWIGKGSINTVKNIYTDMRKVIKELENETYKDVALTLFLPPQALYEASQAKVDDNKKEQIRNKNTFNPKHIKELLAEIKTKLENDDFEDKPRQTTIEREKAYWAYAYLTIVTGRRQAEILKTLSIVKKEDGWHYCGISKDRKDGKCIKAYSLDDDYVFLNELLTYIQEHIGAKELSQREINSKFNNPFNNALKRITGTSFTAKEWREIYTEMLWLKNGGEGSNIDKRDFRAEVLGHQYDGKLSATEHYEGWEAVEDEK